MTDSSADIAALQVDERQLTRQALWERKLLDFSLRNSLLNTRFGKRALLLDIHDVAHLEDRLQMGDGYSIAPKESSEESNKTTDAAPGSRNESHILPTTLSLSELKPVVTNLYRGARTAMEENGANALFIAIGMLKWFVTEKSDQPRLAPILLLPVNIIRNGAGFLVRMRDEETILNITLIEFLRQQYKLSIPEIEVLPTDDNGVNVSGIFDTIRKIISDQPRWEVMDESVLGLFSFNKFVMWNDIHANADRLLESSVIRSLVERRLAVEDNEADIDVHKFDLHEKPDAVATPISVDSSQLEAVIESASDKSFILYGPPGTGKSQTITNIIANALYKGKRVLFVAEKMAALQVVQKRLAKIGLDPFCLELHSNKVTKTHFLEQLQQALDVTHGHVSENFRQRSQELYSVRKRLNDYMQAVHHAEPGSLSLFSCIERYLTLPEVPAMDFPIEQACSKNLADLEKTVKSIQELDAIFKLVGHPHNHPLSGLSPSDDHRESLSKLENLLRQMEAAQKSGFTGSPAELTAEWRAIQKKWFIPRFFATNSFLKRIKAIDSSLTKSDIPAFIDRLKQTDGTSYATWLEKKDDWREWFRWSSMRAEWIEDGWEPVVNYIEAGHNTSDTACALQRVILKEWALKTIDGNDALRSFSGAAFEDVIARYKQLTEHFQLLTQKELYCRLAGRIPSISIEAATGSEVNILKRNIANGGRGTSIRRIIEQIPNLMPKLCPCMLMSPISVAQFIDLRWPKFDLVIFDEASQMPTSEAVGAIGRGKSLIVVGDNKQMPPTSFFNTQQVDDEEAEFDDLDSILDDCQALSMQAHYLAFHYRSKHESLIAFSNQEYYDGRLFTFPSSDDRLQKVSLVQTEGVYDKGGKRSNQAEADAVVKEIIRRLSDDELSKRSIGVVAFSMAQQNLIEDVLMETLSDKPELEARAFQCEEPIFIKNLENVQGDERDIILFSVGYGPDKDGNVSMNFGPLNNQGGERRLNVAVTRARYEMIVFSTLRSDQIDLKRSQALGVEGLKKFLKYAENGSLDIQTDKSKGAGDNDDFPIAESIASELRKLGYDATLGVGRSLFKVDVAIVDPEDSERYKLGILIDSRSRNEVKIARDRELTQPSVLQNLGWRVMRVWSVDWFQHRQRVIDSIVQALSGDAPAAANPLSLKAPQIVQDKVTTSKPPALKGKREGKRDIDELHEVEIDRIVYQVVKEQVALPLDAIKLAANRMLGYQRRTPRIDNAISLSVGRLIASHLIIKEGDNYKLKDL
ncbi:MAG: DUF4011 domain-containing protein [Bacteroidaceae bacterium]|nr:DUF4011 domain-containing protein [Bacteroidaceae bacterium]